jgi:hypothetical protein
MASHRLWSGSTIAIATDEFVDCFGLSAQSGSMRSNVGRGFFATLTGVPASPRNSQAR